MGIVYTASGRYSSDNYPHLFIELMSPTNCILTGAETIFIMTIKNTNAYTLTLAERLPLDMALQQGYGESDPKHRWSESPEYPGTISPVFAPGEERQYVWHWRAEPTEPEGFRVLMVYFDVVRPANARTAYRNSAAVELYVGSMNWNVGGYAGAVPIRCIDVLRHTGQIATPTQ